MNDKIDAFIESNRDKYLDHIKEICAQPSVSARNEGVEECSHIVERMLSEHGYETHRIETPGRPVIVGKAKGRSSRTLLCYNHYDVQPPEPLELWETPPFEPTIRDGKLFARGAKDDKGEFITRLFAAEAVKAAHGGELPCNVTFVVEGEEEIGSPHIANFVKENLELLACDGTIWEEGGIDADERPVLNLGRRGILGVELKATTISKDAHSGNGHLLPSAAWRLVHALATLKDADENIKIGGFFDDVLPPTPLDEQHFDQLPDYGPVLRETFGIEKFLRDAQDRDINKAVFHPTCNIEGITTGYQGQGLKTVIPAEATVKIDFRLVPTQDPLDIFDKLKAHLESHGYGDIEVKRLGMMWPDKSPADDPFVLLTAQTAQEVYGQAPLMNPMSGGSSPVYAFAKPLGDIPVVTCGLGYVNNQVHSPNEHIRISDFERAAKHIGRIINGFGDI